MENMEITGLNNQALEAWRTEIGYSIDTLSAEFNVEGHIFRWQDCLDENLQIKSATFDGTYYVNFDGTPDYYSFFSVSGKTEDAAKTQSDLRTCLRLLSEEFRSEIAADYQSKKEELFRLKKEAEAIFGEMDRRKRQQQAAKEAQIEERRRQYEAPGAVWYDYDQSEYYRYVVKSASIKTVVFKVYAYRIDHWECCDIKKVSKARLISDKYKQFGGIYPVGVTDLATQTPKTPKTQEY